MIRSLPHVMARVFNCPLMICPPRLDALLLALPNVLLRRGSQMSLDDGGDFGDDAPTPRGAGYRVQDGVAVLPIRGVLVRRPGAMTPDSTPLQSYERINESLRTAMSDRRVRGVLLDVDSPGGEAAAVMDLAREVRQLGSIKPVWSISNDGMFSAAYAIGSAASRVWLTETGGVGSVGVMAVHADTSQADAAEGMKYSFIHAGARKLDGNPHAPLSMEARGLIQDEVNRLHGMLTETVARHRNLPVQTVRSHEAGLFFGSDALPAGLADQLGTLSDARAALAASVSSTPGRSRSSAMSDRPQPEPAPAPAPQPAPEPPQREAHTDNVVPFDPVAVAGARQRMDEEICALCAIGGFSASVAQEMIRSSMTVEQVRMELQRRQATAVDGQPVQTLNTARETRAQELRSGMRANELFDIRLGRTPAPAAPATQRRV